MGKHDQALALQRIAAHADNPTKAGIATTKYAVSQFSAVAAGVEGGDKAKLEKLLRPRQPYEEPTEAVKTKIQEVMKAINEVEVTL
jgi:4-hydroxy-2-oxoglutarate aldolase